MTADLIITDARVLTLDPDRPRAEAVAVKDGRILAVGSTGEVLALAGPGTRRLSGAARTLIPGFSENHMHLFAGAGEMHHLQLFGLHGRDALADAVRAYAAGHPDEPVLYAQGADYTILGAEPPTRQSLDAILPDRPLMLMAPDHHTAWANTAALERAGLLHGRALPPGNEVVMGADGLATGELREMAAFDPVLAAGGADRCRTGLSTGLDPDPWPTGAAFEADIAIMKRGLALAARHGITSIQNMDGNRYQLALLAELERRGELPCRVKVPFHWRPSMDLSILEEASALHRDFRSGKVTSGFVKIFYDGVLDSGTAVLLEPYADEPGWTGAPLMTPERFAEAAVEIDRRGLQIAVHAIGDGAVRAVLDGYAAARRANGARDSRHRIEHIELVHPDDVPRFAELGVIASMQPSHPPGALGFPLEPTITRIGRARWPHAYATRTLKEAGAVVAFASDWPVAPIDPILGIKAALTREPWDPADPDQRLTLLEAIEAYTAAGAYAEFLEDRKGRLKPGHLADLVLLSADLEAVPAADLHEVHAAVTVCDGEITHEAA
ncbi:amidohydrolase [Chthonobacter rhizosphaerae]|uniref:amidohydrolase n=1 Tax=Chthonobacter rhizosphaerae TaxID=2735553 RepID=UPI0015EF6DBF|nr:amidohydrolase [Chthonobacter rhizosphaerae]